MKLRQVRLNEYSNTTFQLSDAKLSDICGKDVVWKNIRDKKALYVEDYHDIAEWNDKSAPEEYVPNVMEFFCYNDKSAELLPVEIHYPDTKLSYTPFDAKEEWTLAKMGLNAASVSHHQWQHMAETHATMVPIRVELIRNMAFEHPVRSLIEHHARNDLGLELLMPEFLFNPGTMMDDSFGWGGTGSLRYLDHQTLELDGDFEQDFHTEMESRGILDLHIHKYAQYGSKMYDAIRVFVEKYVAVYYALDQVVVEDREPQNWARDCAAVTHLKGFPAKIATREQLVKVLARLVYLDGVKHHAMNGATTWASIALPYSNAALWSAMPTHKGEKID